MSIFTRGKDIKAMEARITDIEKKGYLAPDDNEANEYLKRLLQFAAGTVDFGDAHTSNCWTKTTTKSSAIGFSTYLPTPTTATRAAASSTPGTRTTTFSATLSCTSTAQPSGAVWGRFAECTYPLATAC